MLQPAVSFTRRHCLACALALTPVFAARGATRVVLPDAVALNKELAKALQAGKPLLVMVSLPGCPFCHVARTNFLGPLLAQGQPIVQLDMKDARPVHDLAGQLTTPDQLIRQWAARIAPTVLFFGRGGQEVAPRLEGAVVPDYYGAYLDERLEQARKSVQAPA
jgi:thioredoxin-related protein